MSPIKLALCITELDTGGAERCLTELAVRVDRNRFQPIVYALSSKPEREEKSFLPQLQAAGVDVHFLGGGSIWHFPKVVRRLRRLWLSHRPQVAQTFLFHANIVGRIAAKRAGVGAVMAGVRVAERSSRWHLWLDRVTKSSVARYVCVSRSVADFTTATLGIPAEKIVVIPNGIDLKRYPSPQPTDMQGFGIAAGRRVAVFVGRLEEQKGVKWLIESAPDWLNRLPECDLLLVGDGPLRESLKSTAAAAGIGERVHFSGWRSDVPDILAAADLLILPSSWEGMPNVVLEAMASGRPVVSTNVEGVEELLGPDTEEQTVDCGDTQSLVGKIVGFMEVPGRAIEIGRRNRRRAKENFDISRMVKSYEDLWESLVK